MDSSILLLGLVLAVTLILIVSNRIRPDLVAILGTLAVVWLGLISPAEAVSGFASNSFYPYLARPSHRCCRNDPFRNSYR